MGSRGTLIIISNAEISVTTLQKVRSVVLLIAARERTIYGGKDDSVGRDGSDVRDVVEGRNCGTMKD